MSVVFAYLDWILSALYFGACGFILKYTTLPGDIRSYFLRGDDDDDATADVFGKEDMAENLELRNTLLQVRISYIFFGYVLLLWMLAQVNIPKRLNSLMKQHLAEYARDSGLITMGKPEYLDQPRTFLGSGEFGHTCRIGDTNSAVKSVYLPRLAHDGAKRMIKEVQILHFLKGVPGVLQIESAHLFNEQLYLRTEYLDGGSLEVYFMGNSLFRQATNRQASAVAKQLLQALSHIHSLNVVHRDIKPGNVMLTTRGEVKLIDFGLATRPYAAETVHFGRCGSLLFTAPEVFQRRPYGTASDIWSLGVTVMSLYGYVFDLSWDQLGRLNRAKFWLALDEQVYFPHHRIMFEQIEDEEMRDFFRACLQMDAAERPTAEELLKHPFIVNGGNSRDVAEMARRGVEQAKVDAEKARAVAEEKAKEKGNGQ